MLIRRIDPWKGKMESSIDGLAAQLRRLLDEHERLSSDNHRRAQVAKEIEGIIDHLMDELEKLDGLLRYQGLAITLGEQKLIKALEELVEQLQRKLHLSSKEKVEGEVKLKALVDSFASLLLIAKVMGNDDPPSTINEILIELKKLNNLFHRWGLALVVGETDIIDPYEKLVSFMMNIQSHYLLNVNVQKSEPEDEVGIDEYVKRLQEQPQHFEVLLIYLMVELRKLDHLLRNSAGLSIMVSSKALTEIFDKFVDNHGNNTPEGDTDTRIEIDELARRLRVLQQEWSSTDQIEQSDHPDGKVIFVVEKILKESIEKVRDETLDRISNQLGELAGILRHWGVGLTMGDSELVDAYEELIRVMAKIIRG